MTLGRFLREYFCIDKRPSNAFQWKGQEPFFFHNWYMLFHTDDGEGYSFEHLVTNPLDCYCDARERAWKSKYLSTDCYVAVSRYSSDPNRKVKIAQRFPVSQFSFEARTQETGGPTVTFDITSGYRRFVNSADKENKSIDWYKYNTLKAKLGDVSITSYLNNPPQKDVYHGALDDGKNRVSWDLEVEKVHSFIPSIGGAMRGTFVNMYWSAPRIDAKVNGEVTMNDRVYKVENNLGYQENLYGTELPDMWLWTHCNKFDGHPNAEVSFTISGEEVEILGVKIPQFINKSFDSLAYLVHGGKTYSFDAICDLTKIDSGRRLTSKNPQEVPAYVKAEMTKPLSGLKVVYECFDQKGAISDEWLSSDDSVLSSDLSLVAKASLKIYKLTWKGWSLKEEMFTEKAGGILVGGKKGTDYKWWDFIHQLLGLVNMVFFFVFFFIEETFFEIFAPNARWRRY